MKIGITEINWIFENEYKIHPNFSFEEQTEEFLNYLGSPESQLREGSLQIIGTWIEKSYFSDQQLLEISDQMKENLFIGLDEQNTDSVFLRSFSALILGCIIAYDEACALQNVKNRKSFLTKEKISDYFEASLRYYQKEKDVRGYVEIKEWAHSIAHGADLFKKFSRHRLIDKEQLQQILETFKMKLLESQEDVYKAREELRIAIAIYTLFLRKLLDTNEIKAWFQSFEEYIIGKVWYNYVKEPQILNAKINLRTFLMYMYLLIKNGISNTGFFDLLYYQDNLLQNRYEIADTIESLLLQMDEGHYFISES